MITLAQLNNIDEISTMELKQLLEHEKTSPQFHEAASIIIHTLEALTNSPYVNYDLCLKSTSYYPSRWFNSIRTRILDFP